jgi:sugar lactone lactonase YvrE
MTLKSQLFGPVECVLDARAALGECPRWSQAEAKLYWVDIPARMFHCFDPATGEDRSHSFAQKLACFALRRQGGFVLGLEDGFALLDHFDGEPQPVGHQVEVDRPDNRFNDGRCDSLGRFWAGTVDGTKKLANGALYRLDTDHSVHQMAGGALTANGLAFSPDERTLYWADTPNHIVYAYALDLASGLIDQRRSFATFPFGQGRPDGASVDEAGFYWSALYAGGRLVRISPDGQIVAEVPIPALNCTMIGFGGADLRTAYVTTARQGLSEEELAARPLSGGIFSFRVDTPGLPEHLFAG